MTKNIQAKRLARFQFVLATVMAMIAVMVSVWSIHNGYLITFAIFSVMFCAWLFLSVMSYRVAKFVDPQR